TARRAQALRERLVAEQLRESASDRLRLRLADEPRLGVLHELERAARIPRRHDRASRAERLQRDEAVVLVERRIEDGARPRIQVADALDRDEAREFDARSHAQ